MVLQLDPRIPLVWRTPFDVQFGVAAPAVVLRNLTEGQERLIAALVAGAARSALDVIARSAGGTDVDELLEVLAPVLVRAEPVTRRTVTVCGSGLTAERIARLLAARGDDVRLAATADAAARQQCELAVVVGHYVLDPELHGLWLRRDVAHLPVVLDDEGVTIGPLVVPGSTACLFCLQRYATAADDAWPAIATQLWGRRSLLDTELVASEVAVLVARGVTTQLRLVDGAVTERHLPPHPECGCLALQVGEKTAGLAAVSGSPRQ